MKNLLTAALLVVLFSAQTTALAVEKWGGTLTSFPSENPLAGRNFTVPAILWSPTGTPRGAAILVHGSGGWSEHREAVLGKFLAENGFLALAIDVFSPRGIAATVERQGGALASHVAYEAFSAQQFLVGMGIPRNKIAIVGFSLGGVVAYYTTDRSFFPERTDQFSASIAYYPGCILHPTNPQPVGRLFFLLGEADDWTGTESCKQLAEEYSRAGGSVKVKVYPDSPHDFNDDPRRLQMLYLPKAETYVNCQAPMNSDRVVLYRGKSFVFPREDLDIVREMQRTCTKYGASIWTNIKQKQEAAEDVLEFLVKTIGS